jgi:hypothetical protein
VTLRDEAILMLDKRGAILDTARDVSALLREHDVDACVIGGVAVVLHGHLRTTKDVDVFCADPLDKLRDVLVAAGFAFDADRREFTRGGVPVQLVDASVTAAPRHHTDIDGVRVVELVDLIAMKLRSGTSSVLRAQDIADVIGLIRHRNLRKTLAGQLPKDLRKPFRDLVTAVERGQ